MVGQCRGIGTLTERLSVIVSGVRRASYDARCGISVASSGQDATLVCRLFRSRSVGRAKQSRQVAQVGQLDIGNTITIGERPFVAIDPNCLDAGSVGASDVAIETVADHHRFVW